MDITSPQNAQFKLFHRLLSAKGIATEGLALMAGGKIVADMIEFFPDQIRGVITYERLMLPPTSFRFPAIYTLSKTLFNEIDFAGTERPILLVQTPARERWADDQPWPRGCTLVVPFQNPENVGAVVRSAAAFGVARIVLTKEAAHPFHPKSTRAAGSALYQIPIMIGPALSDFAPKNHKSIGLDRNGKPLQNYRFPHTFALVPGIEGPGLQQKANMETIAIEMSENIESLNAAMAAGIALYCWSVRL